MSVHASELILWAPWLIRPGLRGLRVTMLPSPDQKYNPHLLTHFGGTVLAGPEGTRDPLVGPRRASMVSSSSSCALSSSGKRRVGAEAGLWEGIMIGSPEPQVREGVGARTPSSAGSAFST